MKNQELQQRVKNLRNKKGLSQEELAEKTGLSLRTIQRVENGETVPRGDTLKKLAISLQVSPDHLIDWTEQEDKNVLTILNLSQLGFLAFPVLGIVIPLAIWIFKKDNIKDVNRVGKSIINFQISWTLLLFILYLLFMANMILHLGIVPFSPFLIIFILAGLYIYNLVIILANTISYNRKSTVNYFPAIKFLN